MAPTETVVTWSAGSNIQGMATPPTPGYGPQRPQGGSVSGGPWQLVEVNDGGKAGQNAVGVPAGRSPYLKPRSSSFQDLQGGSLPGRSRSPSYGPEQRPQFGPRPRQPWTPPSQPASPAIQPGGSPAVLPSLPPPLMLQAAQKARQARQPRRERWSAALDSDDEAGQGYDKDDDDSDMEAADGKGFNPSYFVGDWLDSLGHFITVMPADIRKRKGARPSYLATLVKHGMPNKRFTISKDRNKKEWMCGNGVLVRTESSWEAITWRAEDGRTSSWSRPVVEGPVYFDPPPEMQQQMQQDCEGGEAQADYTMMNGYGDGCGAYYWVGSDYVPAESGQVEWKALNLPDDENGEDEAERQARAARLAELSTKVVPSAMPTQLSADAPEFTPGQYQQPQGLPLTQILAEMFQHGPSEGKEGTTPASTPIRTPLMTPINTPMQTPMTRPAPPPLMPLPLQLSGPDGLSGLSALPSGANPQWQPPWMQAPPAARDAQEASADVMLEVEDSENAVEAEVLGGRFEWTLREPWGKLRKYPKDHCIASPLFGRCGQEKNMKIVYYPNGSKTAEPNHCTLALTRGTDSAGIKFEFTVNGRSGGPKVCLGRRIVGDYTKPFSDSEENDEESVIVCFQVLEVIAPRAGD
mmetsp:Transcript_38107/g.89279  ORF Transcript_38107/g.89279 Transcript_38107/m.89279 type:complete len:636 (-) Transcript_38107:117-2024(-)